MSVSLPLNSKFSLKKELPCREETYFFAPAGGEKTYEPSGAVPVRRGVPIPPTLRMGTIPFY